MTSTIPIPAFRAFTVDYLLALIEDGTILPTTEIRFKSKDGVVYRADLNVMTRYGTDWIELREYDPERFAKAIDEAIALGSKSPSNP